jgi:hypothetical protein
MSLTINTAMTTKDGGSVASGAFVQFESYFPMGEETYNVTINVWRSEADKNNGMQQIRGIVEIPNMNFSDTLTPEDFDSLTPAVMHGYVKDYLEGYLGGGTVVINP